MKYEGVARSWADQAVCSDTGRSHFLLHQSVVFQSDDPKKKKKKKGSWWVCFSPSRISQADSKTTFPRHVLLLIPQVFFFFKE